MKETDGNSGPAPGYSRGMKPNKPTPESKSPAGKPRKGTSPLNLSPEQAKREAGKLHDLNADLESRKTVAETTARTTPFGRNE